MNLLSADISRSLGSFCVLSYRYKIRAEAIQAITEYIDMLQTTTVQVRLSYLSPAAFER